MQEHRKKANSEFDEIFKKELERRLRRQCTDSELINAGNDSDLVNEVLWQMVASLYERVSKLEEK